MIEWEQQYELGINEIDTQHKHLVSLVNKMAEALERANQGEDAFDDMLSVLDALKDYTVYHFSFEESLLEKCNYPDLIPHKEQHRIFIEQLESIDIRALDNDPITNGKKLIKMMIAWIFKHIQGTDSLYKSCVSTLPSLM